MIKAGQLADPDELRLVSERGRGSALLDHPGIVPVYEIGEHKGQKYFSMKLVPGGSLAGLKERLIDDPTTAARLMTEVAEALHHVTCAESFTVT